MVGGARSDGEGVTVWFACRRYEDEQRSAFAELQGRAHKDRTLLFA